MKPSKILDRFKKIGLTNYLLIGILITIFLGFYFSFSNFRGTIDEGYYNIKDFLLPVEVKHLYYIDIICEESPAYLGLERTMTSKYEITKKFIFIPYSKYTSYNLEEHCKCKQIDAKGNCI